MPTLRKINDAHIHIGQFNEIYTSAHNLVKFLDSVGVEHFAVSSTTTCIEDYDAVVQELEVLIELAGDRVAPVLWVTPLMIESGVLEQLVSHLAWRCVKIHPYAHQGVWAEDSIYTKKALQICRELDVPLLIHTGGCKSAEAGAFEILAHQNPSQKIVLAHGRPIDQAIMVMKRNPNVWIDTSFMEVGDIVVAVECGLADRILWGSDYPISNYFYPQTPMTQYYSERLEQLSDKLSACDFAKVTYDNYMLIMH